jgi:hypothetical protein
MEGLYLHKKSRDAPSYCIGGLLAFLPNVRLGVKLLSETTLVALCACVLFALLSDGPNRLDINYLSGTNTSLFYGWALCLTPKHLV